jgi:hypothetical protein
MLDLRTHMLDYENRLFLTSDKSFQSDLTRFFLEVKELLTV